MEQAKIKQVKKKWLNVSIQQNTKIINFDDVTK